MPRKAQVSGQAFTIFLLLAPLAKADYVNKFDICRRRVHDILEKNETFGGINNVTIRKEGHIFTGVIHGLAPQYSRDNILALTYTGCVALCGPEAQLAEPHTALSMVATWIFPLAIVLSLPYEAMHRRKFQRTMAAVLNWLGSPQTALTATIHNFRQIREAHRLVVRYGEDSPKVWNDALYVLSCMGQFEILDPQCSADEQQQLLFLRVLMYGLFRPTVHQNFDSHPDGELIKQLLAQLAFQLRMLRRRAVIPTLASLATFLVAYVFSVVLSFAEVGESSTVDPLILGLLFSWLPVLVMFTIVDRNPVSSERTRILISRCMINVHAVMVWREADESNHDVSKIQWWGPRIDPKTKQNANDEQSQAKSFPEGYLNRRNEPLQAQAVVPSAPNDKAHSKADGSKTRSQAATPALPEVSSSFPKFKMGPFIGQGRSTQYAGLSWAVMQEVDRLGKHERPVRSFDKDYITLADNVQRRLKSRRPLSWFITAFISEGIVAAEVLLAFMLAFNTPTVGPGCWSGSFGLYAILSSLGWIVALCFRKPGKIVRALSFFLNTLAFSWLITVTVLVLTGAMNTCWCQTSPFAAPRWGGYMTFETTDSLKDMFNVVKYWATAAAFGLFIPTASFVVTVFWWLRCSHLWKANEDRDTENELRDSRIDWRWLT